MMTKRREIDWGTSSATKNLITNKKVWVMWSQVKMRKDTKPKEEGW